MRSIAHASWPISRLPAIISLGAFADGMMIGQLAAIVHRHPDLRPAELYVDELGVAPRFQRQGIARRLVDAAFALAHELGCPEIWAATEPDNLPARGLYEIARRTR